MENDFDSETSFSVDEIRSQLSRIVTCRDLNNKKVLLQFLQYVVEETLSGRENEIKEYTIGTRALGRLVNFNPQYDASVRIHGGRLRSMLYDYYVGPGKNDPIIIEIRKGAYIPLFKANKSISLSGTNGNGPLSNGRKKLTIAVLPFQDLSMPRIQNYIADALGEQLSTELSKHRDFSIVSYYSSQIFAKQLTHTDQIYTSLGAHYVLTGSIQFLDGQIRINVQLIFTETSEHIWTETYDRKFESSAFFEIADEIAKEVASVTGGYYGVIINHIAKGSADHRVDLLGEHSAVFWHYQYHKEYNAPTLLKAKDALERSLETNPKYALGWAILGEILLDSYLLEINPETIITKSEEFARKAIRLDPYCLHGYQTLAWTYLLQNNREASIQTINECLSDHDHNTDNMGWLALSLVFLGEYERGKQLLDKAMLLNPFYPWCYSFTMSAYYYFNKEYEQAYFWAERINMPSLKFDVTMRAVILGRLNNSNKTKKILKELLELWPNVATEAKPFFKKFILHEPATEHMIEGLTIAGVKVV